MRILPFLFSVAFLFSWQLPTITICNQNTLKKSAVKALLGGYGAAFEELYMSLMLDSMSSHPVPEDK